MVVHSNADQTVAPVNADRLLEQSMNANRLAAPEVCDSDIARPTHMSRGQSTAATPTRAANGRIVEARSCTSS
jgi:hypothetical protein